MAISTIRCVLDFFGAARYSAGVFIFFIVSY